jgi:hypothetical protein
MDNRAHRLNAPWESTVQFIQSLLNNEMAHRVDIILSDGTDEGKAIRVVQMTDRTAFRVS